MRFLFILVFVFSCIAVVAQQEQRPNIVLILADDMGFSDLGAYGGEVQTPHLDQLAKEGVRYKQFYNAARCCPTRASLMTGLYPHQAGMGWMAAADLGTPAYQDNLNNQCVTIAEVLKPAGYSTYMTGKWHLTNERKIAGEITDNWPVQRGFDRYFGIIPGGANYFTPMVYSNNSRYPAPDDFYLTDAISDTSVKYIEDHFSQNGTQPLFMYVAYTAPHWPLHAPEKVIEKYKEIYSKGWDVIREQRFKRQIEMGLFARNTKLSPRDEKVPAWERLSEAEKKEMSLRMAIYAAQIDVMDQGIGRIITSLKAKGQLDNTLIFFLSDNGACAEYISSGKSKAVDGTASTFESYRINWANVSSTPYKEYKHFTHEGGIATPLIVRWSNGIQKEMNQQYVGEYGHLTDIMATCVEVAQAEYPLSFKGHKIVPMQGKSLVPHFAGQSNHRGKIYWEHEANIALRDGKWKLVAKTEEGHQFDTTSLQLYDMEADPTEMKDLSKQYSYRVQQMYKDWNQWAHAIGAFPLDTREYNVRMRAYRRMINGNFDDNLGGWNIKIAPDAKATVTIDEAATLSGNKAALINMEHPGEKPAAVGMIWQLPVKKGEILEVKFKTRSAAPTHYFARLENADNKVALKLINENIRAEDVAKQYRFTSQAAPEDGNYRLALYFGKLQPGDKVWVDDVELKTVNK